MQSRLFLCLFVFSSCLGSAFASEYPPHWPWRGISIENIDYNPEDLEKLTKKININSIQLRLKPRKLAKVKNISPIQAWNESLDWANTMLENSKKLGVAVILTVEGFPIDPAVEYNQTSPKFWLSNDDKNDVITLASELARRFSNKGSELVAYQLMSEPVMKLAGSSIQPPQWNELLTKIIKAIRKNDPDRWIAVSPAPWGLPSGYKKFDVLDFKNIIYGAHVYMPHHYTHQGIRQYEGQKYTYPGKIKGKIWDKSKLISSMSDLRKFQLRHNVPVWIGEFSAIRWAPGAEIYINDLVSVFDEYGWSWTYFSLNGWHGWNPDFSSRYPSEKKWKEDYLGFKSPRWKTLKQLFQ